MTDKIVVLSTCAGEEEAERLARLLIEGRLAACVGIVPRVRSFYRWKGAVESSGECLLIVKSSRGLFDRLDKNPSEQEREIRERYKLVHPGETVFITGEPKKQ